MKTNPLYLLFLLICLNMPFGHQTLFSQSRADQYFEQGAYEEALSEWYEMVSSGNTSAGLYFNIGLAESALNHTGKAMLAFEQARRIKPGNSTIRKAIVDEREKIIDATIPVNPFFLKEWYRQIVMLFRPGVWAILGLVFLLLPVIRFVLFQQKSVGNWRISLKKSRVLLAVGFLLLILAFLSHAELHRSNEAIMGTACAFHQAPTADSPEIREIGEGEKVVIADQIGDWMNIYLLNQDAGWVKRDCLLPVRIGQ